MVTINDDRHLPVRDVCHTPCVILLVNPAAGRAGLLVRVLVACAERGWRPEVVETTSLVQARGVAASQAPGTRIFALGGDGLHQQVAAGAMASGAVLVALPGGRGNDFTAALGLPDDPVAAIRALTERERTVDVGFANDQPFLGVVSVGLDARASRIALSTPRLRGRALYAYAATRAILTSSPATLTVRGDGPDGRVEFSRRVWLVSVANHGTFGGGLRIAPMASHDDGVFDLVAIDGVPLRRFPRLLGLVALGRHVGDRAVDHHRVTSATIAGSGEVFADGEPLTSLPVHVTVAPAALRVLV